MDSRSKLTKSLEILSKPAPPETPILSSTDATPTKRFSTTAIVLSMTMEQPALALIDMTQQVAELKITFEIETDNESTEEFTDEEAVKLDAAPANTQAATLHTIDEDTITNPLYSPVKACSDASENEEENPFVSTNESEHESDNDWDKDITDQSDAREKRYFKL